MAFATLSDIETEVELIVFKAGESEKLTAIQPDAVVLVKGRVDQTEKGTKIIAQEAVDFDPGPEEIGPAIEQQQKKKSPSRSRSSQPGFRSTPGGDEVHLRAPQGRSRRPPGAGQR